MRPKKPPVGSIVIDLDKVLKTSSRRLRKDPRYPRLSKNALDRLNTEIQNNRYAAGFFEDLRTAGCDSQELLRLLAACSEDPEPERITGVLGLDHRRLSAAVKSFSKCALQIEQVNQSPAKAIFDEAAIKYPFQIPESLRNYGALLMFVAELRWRLYWSAAKRRLIFYVVAHTHHFRDKWVAELIATAVQSEKYDERAHSEWRRRNVKPEIPYTLCPEIDPGGVTKGLLETIFFMCEYALLKKLSFRT